jgi:vanillate O-demethylase ferredoxin subunit
MKVKITKVIDAALDIRVFELADPQGAPLPRFSAGSHVDVHVSDSLVRQYSLCNDPNDTHRYMLGVLRDPASRGGSVAMHALTEGDLLEISEPKNHFALAHDATRSILLAGGIGVTPILCMAERLAHLGAPFEMHYCTREAARTAFLERFGQADLKERVHLHFDTAPAEQRVDLDAVLAAPGPGVHLYVCGPGGFIDVVLKTAQRLGWDSANVHREYFTATPVTDEQKAANPDGPFQVKVASTGQVIDVAAGQSIVAALAACGIDVPTSCEQGVCGTCLTRVLAGEPDHRDLYLTDDEHAANDQFLPCCARSKSPLLLLDL